MTRVKRGRSENLPMDKLTGHSVPATVGLMNTIPFTPAVERVGAFVRGVACSPARGRA